MSDRQLRRQHDELKDQARARREATMRDAQAQAEARNRRRDR
jgi:hypothetical protein